MDNREHLGIAPIPALLREFSIPAVIGLLVNGMYNIVDRIFVGQGVGMLGIAGMTVGFPLIIFSLALTLLISVGANVTFGIRLGERRYEEAEEILGNSFVLMIIASLLVTFLCLLLLNPILVLLGASQEVLPYAKDYIIIILIGNVFSTLSLGLTNLMRTAGAPRKSMATQILGTIVNLVLAPLFIFYFNMGIKGAALATILAQIASSIWLIHFFVNKKAVYRIRLKYFKIRKKHLVAITKLGLSPFSMQVCSSIMNVILINMLGTYGGDVAISVIGLLISINAVVIFPIMGISQGMQPIVSYNYGAKQWKRIMQTYKLSVIVSTIYIVVGFAILQLFPTQVISIFTKDKSVIDLGVHSIKRFSLLFPTIGFQIMTSIFFQATYRPVQATILSLGRQLIFLIPSVLILPHIFGFDGIIYSFPVADALTTILTALLIIQAMEKYKLQFKPIEKFKY